MLMLEENWREVTTSLDLGIDAAYGEGRQSQRRVGATLRSGRSRRDREFLLAIAADAARAAGAGSLPWRAFHGQARQCHLFDQSGDSQKPRSSNGASRSIRCAFAPTFTSTARGPWEEFDWVGKDIRIGETVFAVDRKNGRCGATNVNPTTARRDLDIPGSLRATFGHKNLGVYLIVRDGGEIAVGNSVLVPRSAASVRPSCNAARGPTARSAASCAAAAISSTKRPAVCRRNRSGRERRSPPCRQLAMPRLRNRQNNLPPLRRETRERLSGRAATLSATGGSRARRHGPAQSRPFAAPVKSALAAANRPNRAGA